MVKYVKLIKCYDTTTKEFVEVPVTIEVEEFIKRSYWREDMQDRRYQTRKIELQDYILSLRSKNDINSDVVLESIIREQTIEELKAAVNLLDEKEKRMIQLVYEEDKTISAAAREMGFSSSYASRLIKNAKIFLRNKLTDDPK